MTFSDIGGSFPSFPCSLHNLSLVLSAVERCRIADPCISRKPFMRRVAVWTVGLPEKYRAGAESGGINIFAGGNCPSSFRATNHKNTHQATPDYEGGGVPLMCDEKIKAQRQVTGFLVAGRSQAGAAASPLKSAPALIPSIKRRSFLRP